MKRDEGQRFAARLFTYVVMLVVIVLVMVTAYGLANVPGLAAGLAFSGGVAAAIGWDL